MNCTDGVILLGGYKVFAARNNQYYERKYTDLPEHNIIYFTFTFYFIDSWDFRDYLSLKFDNELLQTNFSILVTYFPTTNICGGTYKDITNARIFGSVKHSGSNLTLQFISGLDEGSENESFGFRDITMTFGSSEDPVSRVCGRAVISLKNNDCECPEGEYPESLGVCKSCHENCTSCFGPSEADCYNCAIGTVSNGTHCIPCDMSLGDILDVDGICKGKLKIEK